MERLKGMKKQNKWTILIVMMIFCLVAGFTHISQVRAAEADDESTTDFLNPFDLTVMSMAVTSSSSSAYVPPAKIWIPYRPVFRSPCTPSW